MPGVVHLVDDDESYLTAMKRRLSLAGYEVSTYGSATELLDRLPNANQPSCILLDVRMPDLAGPELQSRLNGVGSTVPIVFLTGHADVPTTVKAIKAGAHDFLVKPVSSEDLLPVIERALSSHAAAREDQRRQDMLSKRLDRLTPREREVFERVVRGKMNKQIAHELGTTERTIKAHRHKVMEKMQVQSVAELVTIAGQLRASRQGANYLMQEES
jgi:RNA polymerase sigma factor (sigma-70 family)